MGIPTSLPVTQPPPDNNSYPIETLRLFKTFTRESYLAEFSEQAPTWNPNRLPKNWFDSSVSTKPASETVHYNIIDRNSQTGKFAVLPLLLDASEASTVNLPGAYIYAPYAVAPTRVMRGISIRISQYYLSLESEARELMAELGGTNLYDEGDTNELPAIYPPDEPRRMWVFYIHGSPVSAGLLLQSRNAKGVGSPGHWDLSKGYAVWVPDIDPPTGLDDKRPWVAQPVRDLLANEQIYTDLMGFGALIRRIDAGTGDDTDPVQFTRGDQRVLREILAAVNQLGK